MVTVDFLGKQQCDYDGTNSYLSYFQILFSNSVLHLQSFLKVLFVIGREIPLENHITALPIFLV